MNAKALLSIVATAFIALPAVSVETKALAIPDFTKGESISANARHDWNLGATGARGWMFCDKMVTSDARQIAITKVEAGSPADGKIGRAHV